MHYKMHMKLDLKELIKTAEEIEKTITLQCISGEQTQNAENDNMYA